MPIPHAWDQLLGEETRQKYFTTLTEYLRGKRSQGVNVFPPAEQVFRAFRLTPPERVKIVILGQDPYHGPQQANGLAFSVNRGMPVPPSLRNIYREVQADMQLPMPSHGDLSWWAEQGVLLLNTVLTVEQASAHAHKGLGWETFTDQVIRKLSVLPQPLVFLLWGGPARDKARLIDCRTNSVLEAPHPSPLSAHRGFLGCRHFSKANVILESHSLAPIDWQLPA